VALVGRGRHARVVVEQRVDVLHRVARHLDDLQDARRQTRVVRGRERQQRGLDDLRIGVRQRIGERAVALGRVELRQRGQRGVAQVDRVRLDDAHQHRRRALRLGRAAQHRDRVLAALERAGLRQLHQPVGRRGAGEVLQRAHDVQRAQLLRVGRVRARVELLEQQRRRLLAQRHQAHARLLERLHAPRERVRVHRLQQRIDAAAQLRGEPQLVALQVLEELLQRLALGRILLRVAPGRGPERGRGEQQEHEGGQEHAQRG
jgi:hypothetical protein